MRFQTNLPDTINRLDEIYTQDIEFLDPLHQLDGSLALKRYLRRLHTVLPFQAMRYVDSLTNEHGAWLAWERDYALGTGRSELLQLRGTTRLKYTSRIYFQEDCYDLSGLLIGRQPLLGWLQRRRWRRLLA